MPPGAGGCRASWRLGLPAAALPGLAGCARSITQTNLDKALRSEGVRTILLEDGLSLYSLYEAIPSRGYLLLERKPSQPPRAGLLRIAALEPQELHALQAAWIEWLTEIARTHK